jgi:hypothetical protein
MKRFFLSLLACALLLSASAQGKVLNDRNVQVRDVKSFHAIHVSGGIHLYLTQGDVEAVAVSASQPKYRDRIITEVENGVLKIYYDHSGWRFWDDDTRYLKAYVSCKLLDALNVSSGARIDVDGSLNSDILSMNLSSGANFTGAVKVGTLKVEQGSGAEATISGMAANSQLEASSGSSINAFGLQTDLCDASTSSGGTLRITVNKELSASAHSGGQINYQGTGTIKEIHTGSGGAIEKR